MSELLDWINTPDPKPATPRTAPTWPSGKSTAEMLSMAEGFVFQLMGMVAGDGDEASQVLGMLTKFVSATKDHEFHGRNWWHKHGDELGRRLRVLFPEIWPEKGYEGRALAKLVERVFPGAWRLPVGVTEHDWARFVTGEGEL